MNRSYIIESVSKVNLLAIDIVLSKVSCYLAHHVSHRLAIAERAIVQLWALHLGKSRGILL